VAPSFRGRHTFESSREFIDRHVKKANREELPWVIDSACVAYPRWNAEALVRKNTHGGSRRS
jgi:hypothetical protein